MEFQDDVYTLSTGKNFYANCGIIGISKNEKGIFVHEGYDGSINYPWEENFTKEERREIANFVINLWNEWAA